MAKKLKTLVKKHVSNFKSFFHAFFNKIGISNKNKKGEVLKKLKNISKEKSNEENEKIKKIISKKPVKKTKRVAIKKTVQKQKPIKKKVSKKKIIKKKSKKPSIKFDKHPNNPIISPNSRNMWESWQTFNPGAVLVKDRVHFLYRAIGNDGMSRLGYANSNDGIKISHRHIEPAYEHSESQNKTPSFNIYSYTSGGSWGGSEDPRLSFIEEDDKIYVTYTACVNGLGVGITSIKSEDFSNGNWNWKSPKIISKPGEVHKNWVLFPEKIKGKYAILHSINPEIAIEYLDDLEFKNKKHIESKYGGKKPKGKKWEDWIRGIGPSPIKTKEGWLIFYQAMDKNDPGKYKVGAMLLDLKNPKKILSRAKKPVLEPDEHYENNGFKPGVVYASGAIIKNGKIFVYYGGADSHVCVATANLNKFLKELKEDRKPKLKKSKKRGKK